MKIEKNMSYISLICTVFNESRTIEEFLKSIYKMSSNPDEIIIVDGGSKDDTVEKIVKFKERFDSQNRIRLIVDSTCNINFTASPVAHGRNIAIQVAKGTIIACTDAGCEVDEKWLERIVYPLLSDSRNDAVGGWYVGRTNSFVQECIALVFLAAPDTVNPKKYLPSSRSFAFRKSVWKSVGGYPEESLTAEDTLFVQRIRAAGFSISYVPNAVVYWKMTSTLFSFIRTIYRYGFGDGFLAINRSSIFKALIILFVPTSFIITGIFLRSWYMVGAVIFWWIFPFRRKIVRALKPSILIRLPVIAFLEVILNISYLIGYLKGTIAVEQPKMSRII
jgi:glycosyltransferase involved in cell wall biosynthesis